MIRRAILVGALLALGVAGWWLMRPRGAVTPPVAELTQPMIASLATPEDTAPMPTATPEYVTYDGTAFGVRATLEYPVSWTVREERGRIDTYQQVRISGPRNAEDTYTCFVSVRRSPVKAEGGRHENLEALVAHYRAHPFVGATFEKETLRTVAGSWGKDVTISYTVPPSHKPGLKPIPIPVRTRTVFVQDGSDLYELIYSADARDYDQYHAVFDRLLETVQLTP